MHHATDLFSGESSGRKEFPWYGWLGIGLVATGWWANWSLPGLRTHWAFFPLWLGYIWSIQGWVHLRKGSSIFSRVPWHWLIMFLLSAPTWWIFEWINQRTGYWEYLYIESFSDTAYVMLCTLNFSVVTPAIFCTTELFLSFSWMKKLPNGPKVGSRLSTRVGFHLLGWGMLLFTLWRPQYGAAFIWMSLYFMLDPINCYLKRPCLLKQTAKGDWKLVCSLWLGSLLCGFCWEMWNYYSMPKWVYHVPFWSQWHVFEMPLAGYLGYLPFSLEIYALYFLIMGKR